jgi:hypothetical protein
MKKRTVGKITVQEYVKAVKRADRAIALEQGGGGFQAVTKVHKSKKTYKRKEGKKIDFDTLFLFLVSSVYYLLESYDAIPS